MRQICWLSVVALCVLVAGCATPNRMTHLRDSLNSFSRQVKWGQIPRASAFVAQDKRAAWLEERLSALQSVKIIDVQIGQVSSSGPKATKAKVMLSFSYHGQDMVQKHALWEQTWEHKKKKGWRLVEERPAVLKKLKPAGKRSWP